MEAWRQRPLGGRTNVVSRNEQRIDLTPTGLLMEGGYTQVPHPRPNECYGDVSPIVRTTVVTSTIEPSFLKIGHAFKDDSGREWDCCNGEARPGCGGRIRAYWCFRNHVFSSSPQAVRHWPRHISALPQDSQYRYLDGPSRISQCPSEEWLAGMARVCCVAHNGLWPRVACYWPISVVRLITVENKPYHKLALLLRLFPPR